MTDDMIKQLMTAYVYAEMDALKPELLEGYDHEYSKRYQRKIRRVLWSEKYFGKRLRLGYAVRRAAIVILAVLGVAAATEVTAKVLGFNPWRYFMKYNTQNKMEGWNFLNLNNEIPDSNLPKAVSEMPRYIPDGMVETIKETTSTGLDIEWEKTKDEVIQYSSELLEEDLTIWYDNEYEESMPINICGYSGKYCIKDDSSWIIWTDSSYNYMIRCYSIPNQKDELLKMAESLYQ